MKKHKKHKKHNNIVSPLWLALHYKRPRLFHKQDDYEVRSLHRNRCTGYCRIDVTDTFVCKRGVWTNVKPIVFPECQQTWGTVRFFSIGDALGNIIFHGSVDAERRLMPYDSVFFIPKSICILP